MWWVLWQKLEWAAITPQIVFCIYIACHWRCPKSFAPMDHFMSICRSHALAVCTFFGGQIHRRREYGLVLLLCGYGLVTGLWWHNVNYMRFIVLGWCCLYLVFWCGGGSFIFSSSSSFLFLFFNFLVKTLNIISIRTFPWHMQLIWSSFKSAIG